MNVKKWFAIMGIMFFVLFSRNAVASENERYRALPTAPSGLILIIDTKEGHIWTWNNNIIGETDASGVNPRISYQGNVRKNMKIPVKSSIQTTSPKRF